MDSVVEKENLNPEDLQLNDKASAIFNAFMCFGAIVSPILGGFLSDNFGYRYANDSVSMVSGAYTVAFILIYLCSPKQHHAHKENGPHEEAKT